MSNDLTITSSVFFLCSHRSFSGHKRLLSLECKNAIMTDATVWGDNYIRLVSSSILTSLIAWGPGSSVQFTTLFFRNVFWKITWTSIKLKQARLLAPPPAFTSGTIAATAVTETTLSLSDFLWVAATNSTGQNASVFIDLLRNGDMKADRNCGSLLVGLPFPASFHFPGRFCARWQKKKSIVEARVIQNKSKHRWSHYSFAVIVCNQHLLYNDMLKQKKTNKYCYWKVRGPSTS